MSNPINIFTNKISIGDKNPDNLNIEYYFNLKLIYKNNEIKEIKKYSKDKYCNLLSFSEKYSKNNLKKFILEIKEIPNINKNTILIEEKIIFDDFSDNKIFRDEQIYLEFVLNDDNYLSSNCNINNMNYNRLFITPPNY